MPSAGSDRGPLPGDRVELNARMSSHRRASARQLLIAHHVHQLDSQTVASIGLRAGPPAHQYKLRKCPELNGMLFGPLAVNLKPNNNFAAVLTAKEIVHGGGDGFETVEVGGINSYFQLVLFK